MERLGAYDLITALDRFGPTDPRPGQFYMLAAASAWGGGGDERPYLPRAFSYARARVEPDGLALSFLLEAVGPGTERLSELSPDERLALVGPLGVGFRPPAAGTRPLLVGGGIGAAPLLCWQEELRATAPPRSCSASAARPMPRRPRCSAGEPQVVTDDGSVGRQALVTELLAAELDADARRRSTRVARPRCSRPCGRSARSARCPPSSPWSRGWPADSAPASAASCPTKDGYVRLCVDGPVLDSDALETALVAGARAFERRQGRFELCGVPLRGPVLNGSGTFDAIAARRAFGDALIERFPFDAFVSKTITLEPRQGNPPPRLWETPAGLINSIGLPNKGLDGFLESDLPRARGAARCRWSSR